MRQLGNAVPVKLAEAVTASIAEWKIRPLPIPKLARQTGKWLNGEMPKPKRPDATIDDILSQVKHLHSPSR